MPSNSDSEGHGRGTSHDLGDREYQIIRETDRRAIFDGKPPALRDAICWGIDPGAFYPRKEVSGVAE